MRTRGQGVLRYRGSKRRLRFIKGRDEANPIFWLFVVGAAAFLAVAVAEFLSP